MTPTLVALGLLATFRLTRLATTDTITEPIRKRAGRLTMSDGLPVIGRPRAWYFVTCPWCTSVWIGAGVAALLWAWPAETIWPAAALAFSGAAGLLHVWGGGD